MTMAILKELGVYLGPGEDLLGVSPDNPAGFWENFSFVELNETLLERARAAWDYVPTGGIWPHLSAELVRDANDLVAQFNDKADVWGWKDPRTSLLLQFWQERLASRGTEMKLIVVVRHPLEVAASLRARNGFSIRHGLRLWTEYNQSLLRFLPATAHLVTHYDVYFSDWIGRELARLIAFTGVTSTQEQLQAASSLVRPDLKHEHLSNIEGDLWAVHPTAGRIYAELCSRAGVLPEPVTVQKAEVESRAEVSIIIPTLNGVEHTRACIESIQRCTQVEHEIIVVDNGSTDGTVEYLRGLSATGEIVALTNRQNRGFAGAVNQGLALATGRRLVLLNNDTIVTDGWLAGMLHVMSTNPDCGLVGPMSNYVSGSQQIAGLGQMDDDEITSFAQGWSIAHRGVSVRTNRLVGFCLMIDRPVVEKLGGFDEQFFPGCFEDDDYGLRAQAAGFELRIAREVFVYHVGGRAFAGLGKGVLGDSLLANWERFKAKWHVPQETPYGAPYSVEVSEEADYHIPLPVLQTKPRQINVKFGGQNVPDEWPPITLCMIVKDETHNLADCINSLAGLPDHIIVVDTGSTDDTVAIASSLGAEVRHFEWCDDFAAARNASIEDVPGEWILWMDADDRVSERAVRQIKQAAASNLADAHFFKIVSRSPQADGMGTTASSHLRLFRNGRGVHFVGAIHEDPTRTALDAGLTLATTDIEIQHVGYERGKGVTRDHALRNRAIVLSEIAKDPADLEMRFHLATCCQILGDLAGVVEQAEFILSNGHPRLRSLDELYRTHVMLITSLANIDQSERAFRALHRAIQEFPDNRHLWVLVGMMVLSQGDGRSALEAFDKAERLPPFEFRQWPDETIPTYRKQALSLIGGGN